MVVTCLTQTSQAGVGLSGLEDPINWAMGHDWAPLSTKGQERGEIPIEQPAPMQLCELRNTHTHPHLEEASSPNDGEQPRLVSRGQQDPVGLRQHRLESSDFVVRPSVISNGQ